MAPAITGKDCDGEDIQAAIAKAVQLRALHAALMMQGTSPAAAAGGGGGSNPLRFLSISSSSSPTAAALPNSSTQYSAQTYPVFTPSYGDEPLPRYQQLLQLETQTQTQTLPDWETGQESILLGLRLGLGLDNYIGGEEDNTSSRKVLLPPSPALITSEPHFSWKDDEANHIAAAAALQSSPATDVLLSSRRRRNSLGDFKSVYNTYSYDEGNNSRPINKSETRGGGGGMMFSWLPRLKKKKKKDRSEASPARGAEAAEEISQLVKNTGGITSIEMLKKELIEAIQKKDAAMKEAGQMKNSFGELREKLENLEAYCEELKRALRRQAAVAVQPEKKPQILLIDGSTNATSDNSMMMPVTDEVMVEGFLQVVSEARLSVKYFCKALVAQIEEAAADAPQIVENLNLLLQPHKLSLSLNAAAKYSKAVLCHVEAIINQQLYPDFENCVFQRNGSAKLLDPRLDRQAQFSSFVALRNLSWNQVLKKGTKYYSEEFSKFCDQKMSCIITTLNWTRKWPEQLLQSFFVAAKCIWLLHLLAFSFYPPLMILRVEENRLFDGQYMEDVLEGKEKLQIPSRVKVMVMPGFYVQDRVLRCKVLCKYKNVP
ncbi:hypothetical protein Dimus_011690 [Dionaea muscipula]